MLIRCDICGRPFRPGSTECGLPNGVGLVMEDGIRIDICTGCIMSMDKAELSKVADLVKEKKQQTGRERVSDGI